MGTNRTRRIVGLYFAVILTASSLPCLALAQASRSPVAPRRELVEATLLAVVPGKGAIAVFAPT